MLASAVDSFPASLLEHLLESRQGRPVIGIPTAIEHFAGLADEVLRRFLIFLSPITVRPVTADSH
jgi:hypothetical protein